MLRRKISFILEFVGIRSFVHHYIKRQVSYRFRSQFNYALYEYDNGKKLGARLQELEFKLSSYQLDVGCGLGGVPVAFAETMRSALIVGLDLNKDYLNVAKRLAKEKLVENVNFVRGDAHSLCFRDQSFDAAVSTHTLEHVKDPFRCLEEIERVLKDQGMIYMSFHPFWGPTGGHLYVYLPFPWIHYLPKQLIKLLLVKAPRLGTLDPNAEYDQFLELNKCTTKDIISYIDKLGFDVKEQNLNYLLPRLALEFLCLQYSCILRKKALQKLKVMQNIEGVNSEWYEN
jgi:ubiquinone/menaquinone biosynthesis C-methylase UbiE